jgi:hypothetical protein
LHTSHVRSIESALHCWLLSHLRLNHMGLRWQSTVQWPFVFELWCESWHLFGGLETTFSCIVVTWILDNLIDFSLSGISLNRSTGFLSSDPLLLSFSHFVEVEFVSLSIFLVVLPSTGVNDVLLLVFGIDDTFAMLHMVFKLTFVLWAVGHFHSSLDELVIFESSDKSLSIFFVMISTLSIEDISFEITVIFSLGSLEFTLSGLFVVLETTFVRALTVVPGLFT